MATWRGTIGLLGVLTALVGYLGLIEIPAHRDRTPLPSAPALLTAGSEQPLRIELSEPGLGWEARRDGTEWKDTQGRAAPTPVVEDLIATLTALRPLMVVDAHPADLSAYGLGPDATRLRVFGSDGRTLLTLELGERNPAWTANYACVGGSTEVVLVGGVLRWELRKLRAIATGTPSLDKMNANESWSPFFIREV